jgi:hypothetical protein
MATIVVPHALTMECNRYPTRHEHPYNPPLCAAQRCSCGHTKWKINIGGILNPVVSCAKCTRQNRAAIAYEMGRIAGATGTEPKAAL